MDDNDLFVTVEDVKRFLKNYACRTCGYQGKTEVCETCQPMKRYNTLLGRLRKQAINNKDQYILKMTASRENSSEKTG